MKTRLDETNKMRKLMGLSLLTEQISGDTRSKLDQQIGFSNQQGEELEDELVNLMGKVNELKNERQIKREKLHELFKQLRTNKITGRMLKREKRKVERLQKQIDKLENTTPETRKAQTKKILKDISVILTAGISTFFMKDVPMVKALIQKVNKATDLPRLH